MILEIKVDKIVNNSKGYGRMAAPVTHTWKWRQAAKSTDKQELVDYAEMLPLSHYFRRKRTYRIVGITR